MEWVGPVIASLVFLVLLGPLVVLTGSLVAIALVAQFVPASPTVDRTSFVCPFSKRDVKAEFLSWQGAEQPADVLSCSAFPDPYQIRCRKECLGLAHTGAVSSPMMPRFSLIAGGTAYRT